MMSLFDNVYFVKSDKKFRIPSETTLQHSIFDRKRQICILHTGQCKSTGGYLQRPGIGFFRTGAGENAIPAVIIMFV